MKKIVSAIASALLPESVFRSLRDKLFQRRFIVVQDPIAGKPISMYLREDSMMERRIMQSGLYGDWEKESLKVWAHLAKQASVIIDIGSNTGVFALVAQNNNAQATVVAVEPIQTNFNVLSRNVIQNNFPIRLENVALSDTTGSATMYMLKDRLNYMTSINDNRYALHPEVQGSHEVVPIEVPMSTFSDVAKRHSLSTIQLIKIDVEGHELTVLRSMLAYIEASKPIVLIEIIGDDNAIHTQQLFDPLGYRYVAIHEDRKSEVVDRLWDNDHHNFLLCHESSIAYLREKELVA